MSDTFNKDKFLLFLKERNLVCPVCSFDSWGLDGVAEIRSFHGGAMTLSKEARIYPVVPVFCVRCGYVALFSAVTTGAISAEKLFTQSTGTVE